MGVLQCPLRGFVPEIARRITASNARSGASYRRQRSDMPQRPLRGFVPETKENMVKARFEALCRRCRLNLAGRNRQIRLSDMQCLLRGFVSETCTSIRDSFRHDYFASGITMPASGPSAEDVKMVKECPLRGLIPETQAAMLEARFEALYRRPHGSAAMPASGLRTEDLWSRRRPRRSRRVQHNARFGAWCRRPPTRRHPGRDKPR